MSRRYLLMVGIVSLIMVFVFGCAGLQGPDLQSKVDSLQSEKEALQRENLGLRAELELYKASAHERQPFPRTTPDITAPREKRIILEDKIYFNSGSADLTSKAKKTLDSIIKKIKKEYPNAYIKVEGHSDNSQPSKMKKHKSNDDLSEARAKTVMNYLIKYGKFDLKKISHIGCGTSQIVDAKNQAKNRRVEIVILPKTN